MKASTQPIWLIAVTALLILTALYMALIYAPTEATMGDVQRIFYFHVPSAWLSFIGFFLVFLFSFTYLITGKRKWDIRAHAAAEVGVLFCTIVLLTGPIWAKPVWGIWWTWDARLTLTLVLWLTYVGYLMLRHYVADPERRAMFSAIVGIIGFIDVPIVYFSIRWWRTQHPQPVIMGGEDSGMDPPIALTLMVALVAWIFLFSLLYRMRVSLGVMQDDAEALHEKVDSQGSAV